STPGCRWQPISIERTQPMNRVDIVRAWKDEEYRLSLTEEQLAALPANPAGTVELDAAELEAAGGGVKILPLPRTLLVALCPRSYRVFWCPPKSFIPVTCPPKSFLLVACPPKTILVAK